MGYGDGQARPLHSAEKHGAALRDFHRADARLKLLGAIAQKARPVFAARDELFEMREHLAAVAHAERKGVRIGEKGGKLVSQCLVE